MTTMTTTDRPIDLDGLTMAAVRAGALRGVAVTVLGAARSGIGLSRFFAGAGARVTLYDGRPADELGPAFEGLDPELAAGSVVAAVGPDVDPAAALDGAALVATSPSINPDFPTTEPRLRALLRRLVDARLAGDPTAPALVSEADLFLRLCPAPTVGVTGTKGKTTTSSLAATLLGADPAHPVELGGNIGRPLVELLPALTTDHRVVIELSELQLPTLSRGTTVAVYTNVTSDHLDRHGSLQAYRRAKRRLAELLDPAGALVLNADDPVVAGYAADGAARPGVRQLPYRLGPPLRGGLGVVDGWIVAGGVSPLAIATDQPPAAGAATDGRIMPLDELAIPGAHNVSNALAAIGAALLFGIGPAAIRGAAGSFRGVEHRLETVATVGRVRFVNDSQGTQPDAVVAALRAFDGPIVLIAGGRDKGVDLGDLGPVVADRAAAAVLIGESGPTLARLFRAAGLERTELVSTLEEAVGRAAAIARETLHDAPGTAVATVLLSPAAASFDMFVDYEARGRAFKAAVADLVREGDARRLDARGLDVASPDRPEDRP
ncbi:MAG: UDP-N-acetylmuramoyl-L-alanine--D-glutamate ligase [Candidatus Limnocylindrales bacterium]